MKYSRKAKSNIRSKRRKLSKRNKSSVRRKTRTRVLRRKFSKNVAKTSKRLVGGKRRQRKKRKNIKRTYKIRNNKKNKNYKKGGNPEPEVVQPETVAFAMVGHQHGSWMQITIPENVTIVFFTSHGNPQAHPPGSLPGTLVRMEPQELKDLISELL